MSDWTAARVQAALLRKLECGRRSTCMTRYTPRGWFECDVAEVTKAGYLREYEIKVSRQDFRNDAQKHRFDRVPRWWAAATGEQQRPEQFKHYRLENRDRNGPSSFCFVVPRDLVRLDEVPEWAGLYCCWTTNRGHDLVEILRPPPKLHRQTCDPEIEKHMRSVAYYRYLQQQSTFKKGKA